MDLWQWWHWCHVNRVMAGKVTWHGVEVQQHPLDLWVIAQIIQRVRPTILFEIGTRTGGSALFYQDIIGRSGTVLSCDISPRPVLSVPCRALFITADAYVTDQLAKTLECNHGPVMVIDDASHDPVDIARGLAMYSKHITLESYYIVQDTISDAHQGVKNREEAISAFLAQENGRFVRDAVGDDWIVTNSAGGFLRRVSK